MSDEIIAQETEQVVDQPLVDESPSEESREDRFAAALEGRTRDANGRFTKTEQPPADEPSPQEEVAVDPEPTPVSEGPSEHVLEAARMLLDDEDLQGMKSDREILVAMRMVKKFQAEQEPEKPAIQQEDPFALEWPDDDVPADDPYRKQIERLVSHLQEKDAKREEHLQAIAQWALARDERDQEAREMEVQTQFDKLLDDAAIEGFGKSDAIAANSPVWQKRNAAYAEYATLTTQLGYTPELAMQAIAMKHGKPVSQPQPTPTGQLLKQSKARLGGAATRPAPAPAPSRLERFQQEIEALN